MALITLKKRAEFLRVRNGARWSCPSFVLEAKLRVNSSQDGTSHGVSNTQAGQNASQAEQIALAHVQPQPKFGFTVTKKIGNAVVRNRIRRRLKAVVALTAPRAADHATDYVVIARKAAFDRPFGDLKADFEQAFRRTRPGSRPGRQH